MVSEVSTQLLRPSLSLQTRNLKLLKESHAIGVFIDFKKAIDSIKNSILLDKLNFCGVRDNSLSWFQDDLNSRCQFLELANCRSSLQTIKCGFPQSSLLGSFLFLVYINDIFASSTVFSFILFADDTTLFLQHNNNFIINLALLIVQFPLLLHGSRLRSYLYILIKLNSLYFILLERRSILVISPSALIIVPY